MKRATTLIVTAVLMVAGCGSSSPTAEPVTEPVVDDGTCEAVLAAPPGAITGGPCRWDSTGVESFIVEFRCVWTVDTEDTDGTWFGVEGGEWLSASASEFVDAVDEACAER